MLGIVGISVWVLITGWLNNDDVQIEYPGLRINFIDEQFEQTLQVSLTPFKWEAVEADAKSSPVCDQLVSLVFPE